MPPFWRRGRHRRCNNKRSRGFGKKRGRRAWHLPPHCTLLDVPAGTRTRVLRFSPELTNGQLAHLQSYGLMPGSWVSVIQQSPVTVLKVDNLEIALEHDLAMKIQVEESTSDREILATKT